MLILIITNLLQCFVTIFGFFKMINVTTFNPADIINPSHGLSFFVEIANLKFLSPAPLLSLDPSEYDANRS